MTRTLVFFAAVMVGCGGSISPADALKNACAKDQAAPVTDFCLTTDQGPSITEIEANASARTVFQRTDGPVFSFAQTPDGAIYFAGFNALYRLDAISETVVHSTSRFVGAVRVDAEGQVYFSEANRDGGGTIYKLTGTAVEPFYEVKVSKDIQLWAGDFNFDPHGGLWLSTGNVVPSVLYRVDNVAPAVYGAVPDLEPQPVFVSLHTSFMGFRFISDTQIIFAALDQAVRVLDLCTNDVRAVYTAPQSVQLRDVNSCPR